MHERPDRLGPAVSNVENLKHNLMLRTRMLWHLKLFEVPASTLAGNNQQHRAQGAVTLQRHPIAFLTVFARYSEIRS